MSGRKKRTQSSQGWPSPEVHEDAPAETAAERAERRAGSWKKLAALGVLAVAISIASLSAVLLLVVRSGGPSGPPRAAIVDQLSLTFPNPAFVEEATDMLEEAGYLVDYYPGQEVTVNLYRELPTRGYDYVILRVHSAQFDNEWRGKAYDESVLFTSELYSPALYIAEQWEVYLNPAFTYQGATRYFAVAANFVESGMAGDFGDATVILMGCGGLRTTRTAEAFVQRGAGAVVGWSGLVSAEHTDAATERLLEHLLDGRLPPDRAVAQTNAELGPDPAYDSILLSYPSEG